MSMGLKILIWQKTTIKIKKENLILDFKFVKRVFELGFSPFFMSSAEGILQMSFNRQLLFFGGDIAVSAMTIMLSLNQMLFLPMEGIAQGAQPITSFNFGAKNYQRVKDTIRLAIQTSLAFSVIAVIIMELFPGLFVNLFATDPQLVLEPAHSSLLFIERSFY